MLGLVAQNNVEISSSFNGASNSPPGINIDAAIFANTGSFTALNYDKDGRPSWQDGSGNSTQGTIRLLGSVAQQDRGPVGKLGGTAGHVGTGFLKNYKYDNRLYPKDDGIIADKNATPMSPPYFPCYQTAGPLTIENWWESSRMPFDVDRFYY